MSKVRAIKRESYFTRVRKRWKRRDVIEINETHSKFLFTQYIKFGLRNFLEKQIDSEPVLCDEDYKEIKSQDVHCSFNNVAIQLHSHAPHVFYVMRQMIGMSPEEYLEIISPISSDAFYLEFLSNSKSGQNFFLTNNKQLMIKTITRNEADFFFNNLNKYMEHFQKYPHSLLVKFLGLHSIKMKKLQKPVYFVVMLSIFYPGERIHHRYDIKACEIGRFTKPSPNDSNIVVILKEKNLKSGKINLGSQRDWFLRQIKFDTDFLQKLGVLDYSLLVGMQSLQDDEMKDGKDLASVVSRTKKSISKGHSVFRQPQRHSIFGNGDLPHTPASSSVQDDPSLPGMVEDVVDVPSSSRSSDTCVDADTGENHSNCESMKAGSHTGDGNSFPLISNGEIPPSRQDRPDVRIGNGSSGLASGKIKSSTGRMFSQPALTSEEAVNQNRRLLPNYRNELHVIDGEERYYLGLIDFFTRYTLKKRLENAYKRIIHPPLSFSTVHPDLFASRFNKYWEEHSE